MESMSVFIICVSKMHFCHKSFCQAYYIRILEQWLIFGLSFSSGETKEICCSLNLQLFQKMVLAAQNEFT